MAEDRIVAAIEAMVGDKLARELVRDFRKMRADLATKTLERASPGKFVETFVQCLQQIASGTYDAVPKVDHYLDKVAATQGKLPESLRITAPRIARSVYTVRNKRNIAHKGEVDPNTIDLAYAHHAAAWIMAELVRISTAISMEEAGRLIALLQAPVGDLVEEIDGVRLVHGDLSVRSELLILLHSHYPDAVPLAVVKASLSRRGPSTAGNKLRELEQAKFVHGDSKVGYRLTSAGFKEAVAEIQTLVKPEAA
ncbi:hypothetical protein DA69_02755 [Brevundimonas naejangsanensis]|uniref:Uncharacterized protein n=1 Tax=Brevundimonas naejangsanensis TaxID=588932 RepID=A0A172Y3T8_9CAUL|nr:hypothetical protein [Brevundimonas naejangsanensis]ANF53765.1 hypothetical protein DA69_02755 [Brevundimonas naejangsanensis]